MRTRITILTFSLISILFAAIVINFDRQQNPFYIELKSFSFEYMGNTYRGELCSMEALLSKNCSPVFGTEHFSTFWQLHEDGYSRTKSSLGKKGRVLSPYAGEGINLHFDRWNKDPLANTVMIQYPSEVLEEVVLLGQDLSHASIPTSKNPGSYETGDEVIFATQRGTVDGIYAVKRHDGETNLNNSSRIILIQHLENLLLGG